MSPCFFDILQAPTVLRHCIHTERISVCSMRVCQSPIPVANGQFAIDLCSSSLSENAVLPVPVVDCIILHKGMLTLKQQVNYSPN